MPQTSKEERAQWAELCARATPWNGHYEDCGSKIGKNCYCQLEHEERGMPQDLYGANNALLNVASTALPRLLADYDELNEENEDRKDMLMQSMGMVRELEKELAALKEPK